MYFLHWSKKKGLRNLLLLPKDTKLPSYDVMGINTKPTRIAEMIPKSPREKSSSSTSFRIGESSSRCHTRTKTAYASKIFILSKPTNPDRTRMRVVNSFVTNAPRRPNIVKDIRPPSVSRRLGLRKQIRIRMEREEKLAYGTMDYLVETVRATYPYSA